MNEIFNESVNVWKDVWETAEMSAAIGGIVSGVTTTAKILSNKKATKINSKKGFYKSDFK